MKTDTLSPARAPSEHAIADAVSRGLSSYPKCLPAWLFYDETGSRLFEQITTLSEYYLTRTERELFHQYANDILNAAQNAWKQVHLRRTGTLRLVELGAGSAQKTGILLRTATHKQDAITYLPVDVSETALLEAQTSLQQSLRNVTVYPILANYLTEQIEIPPHNGPTLALYIGSSIGNFDADEAVAILTNLRHQLRPGDSLLLGTDMVKDAALLETAYNDGEGVTAEFNRNILGRINRDLGADFNLNTFQHHALWNPKQSRIEMHLRSQQDQHVTIPALHATFSFARGETIHTENSYKFSPQSLQTLLHAAGYRIHKQWTDAHKWYSVTLATLQ